MEVKPGYKQTEVGVVPDDWSLKRLGEVVDLQVGYAFKSAWFSKYDGVPLLRGENVGYGRPDWTDTRNLPLKMAKHLLVYLLKPDDIVIGMDRTFTKSGTKISLIQDRDCPCLLVQRVGKFVPRGCDAQFLWTLLSSAKYWQSLKVEQKGMDIPHLSRSEILSPFVALPPTRVEQEVIAAALSDIDALITGLEKLITKKRDIKQGVMQELLTGKTRLPGFSGEWEVVQLDDCLDLLTDFEANGSFADLAENVHVYDNEQFAWYVRATDLENSTPNKHIRYVDEKTYKYLKKTSLYGGEVLITKRGEIGKVYLFDQKTPYATLGPNLYLLKLNSKVLPYYIYLYFRYGPGNKLLTKNDASTTLGALYKNDVKSIQIDLPSIPEQQAIVTVLHVMEVEINGLGRQRDKTRLLKQGMMQELLSGRVRLV